MGEQKPSKSPWWKNPVILSWLGIATGALGIVFSQYPSLSPRWRRITLCAGLVIIIVGLLMLGVRLYIRWLGRRLLEERAKLEKRGEDLDKRLQGLHAERAAQEKDLDRRARELDGRRAALEEDFQRRSEALSLRRNRLAEDLKKRVRPRDAERGELEKQVKDQEKKVQELAKELDEGKGRRIMNDDQQLKEGVTQLLQEAKDSLHYYGGAGFIGDHVEWRRCLSGRLNSKTGGIRFDVKRIVDVKTPSEMRALLKGPRAAGDDATEAMLRSETSKYIGWLLNHARFLVTPYQDRNWFYAFEGSPIWKYGTHLMIFDKTHVVLVATTKGGIGEEQNVDGTKVRGCYEVTREAIFLRSHAEFARALAESIEWLGENLGRLLAGTDIKKLVCTRASDKKHFREFVEDVIQGYALKRDKFTGVFPRSELAKIFPGESFYDVLYQ